MDTTQHNLTTIFAQLGLANDDASISAFVEKHKPVDQSLPLYEASFWNEAQSEFLQESVEEDSDWAILVDHLASLLRGSLPV